MKKAGLHHFFKKRVKISNGMQVHMLKQVSNYNEYMCIESPSTHLFYQPSKGLVFVSLHLPSSTEMPPRPCALKYKAMATCPNWSENGLGQTCASRTIPSILGRSTSCLLLYPNPNHRHIVNRHFPSPLPDTDSPVSAGFFPLHDDKI